ncbi:MAG: hypothetical protein K6C98_09745 [Treponema sp.]|nr:hypothetical protein [Treponema sp.]
MTTYELEMDMRLVRGNGSVAQSNYAHFCATSFLNLFKKMDNLLHDYSPDWEINVRFCKIENLHLYEVNFNKIKVQNEKDRSILSEFTTTGQAPFDA